LVRSICGGAERVDRIFSPAGFSVKERNMTLTSGSLLAAGFSNRKQV
jgi:hypothetical protein